MKYFLLAFALISSQSSFSQDTLKIKGIDSIAAYIDTANFLTQKDSIIRDLPNLGLNMKTYLTMVIDGKFLKKYVNYVKTISTENGISVEVITSNTFYFNENHLIKVSEFAIQGKDKVMHMDWYYSEDKPLYWTDMSENSKSRADLLLTMGKSMQEGIEKRLSAAQKQ